MGRFSDPEKRLDASGRQHHLYAFRLATKFNEAEFMQYRK